MRATSRARQICALSSLLDPHPFHQLIAGLIMAATADATKTYLTLKSGGISEKSEKFYSHTKRTDAEAERDAQLRIDRRSLSNLWEEDMKVGKIDAIEHSFLHNISGKCVEAWFQAAKCADEQAAKFCFNLPNARLQAHFGRGHLPLTNEQVEYFKTRDMELKLVDITKDVKEIDNPWEARSHKALMRNKEQLFDEKDPSLLAWADENKKHFFTHVPNLVNDWDSKKNKIMFELQQAKFGKEGQKTALMTAEGLRDANILHVTEHAEDDIWGDGMDGSGNNRLGKMVAAILVHASWNQEFENTLKEPANKTVVYS